MTLTRPLLDAVPLNEDLNVTDPSQTIGIACHIIFSQKSRHRWQKLGGGGTRGACPPLKLSYSSDVLVHNYMYTSDNGLLV